MIAEAVRLIADELGKYIDGNKRDGDSITSNDVILDNIAALENDSSNNLQDKIIITIVNIEEESTLKNQRHVRQTLLGGSVYEEPPVFINLYLLFCVTFDKGMQDAYETALHRLSLIIQFFQAKRMFNVQNAPHSSIATDETIPELVKNELRITLELYTLTFEQINHLWGSLGGKQVPFVMYKLRLVKIRHQISQEAPLIEEVSNNFQSFNDC